MALALDRHVDVLITADATLLDLVRFSHTIIVCPADVVVVLQEQYGSQILLCADTPNLVSKVADLSCRPPPTT